MSGDYNAIVWYEDGTAYAKGAYNEYGQLGTGMMDEWFDDYDTWYPVLLNDVVSVVMGNDRTWFLCSDGSLYMAGGNECYAVPAMIAEDIVRLYSNENGYATIETADGSVHTNMWIFSCCSHKSNITLFNSF